jgi:hypothetical protein
MWLVKLALNRPYTLVVVATLIFYHDAGTAPAETALLSTFNIPADSQVVLNSNSLAG